MLKFTLHSDKPVATASPDHLFPHGTKQDNSRNPLFNKKLYALFGRRPLHVLDLGCAGGGFVKECLNDGHTAIGLEGSDYSRKTGRAEWAAIPDHLFTCDLTAPFSLKAVDGAAGEESDAQFDAITAWEFIEHIRAEELPAVCENARRHLRPGGLWIMSVSPNLENIDGVSLHQTVQDQDWWIAFFRSAGFTNHPHLVEYFARDWVRGPFQGAPNSFHVVLTYRDDAPPSLPSTPPYTAHDLFQTGAMFIEQVEAGGDGLSHIDLTYTLWLLDAAHRLLGEVKELNYFHALALLRHQRVAEAGAAAMAELRLQPDHAGARRILERMDPASVSAGYSLEMHGWKADPEEPVVSGPDSMPQSTWSPEVISNLKRADTFFAQGNLEAARDAFREALDLAPDDPQLIVTYGNILLRLNDIEAARREFVKATVLAPNHAPAHLNLAAVLGHLGRTQEAEASAGRALALNPNDSEAHKLLGRLRIESGRYLEGVQNYLQALRQNPDDVDVLMALGRCYVEANDATSAKILYERALAIQPDHPFARENLTYLESQLRYSPAGVPKQSQEEPSLPISVAEVRAPNGQPKTAPPPTPAPPVFQPDHYPKISIVTPSYNCARQIRGCIESVLAQNYPDFEHIIVDGASTDGTVEILKEYPHLRWISEPDGGEAEALNKALRMVTGDIIGWLNADDCYVEDVVHKVAEELKPAQGHHLVYGKTIFIGEHGSPTNWVIPYAPLNLVTLTRWFKLNLFQPSIFFSTKLFHDVGFFREDLKYGMDYEYWFRIAVKGYQFHYVDQVLSKAMIYRPGGKTETPYTVKSQEWLDICRTYLALLSTGEQIHFWRDYYEFRIRNHNSEFYYNKATLNLPDSSPAVAGFALVLKELGLIPGNINAVFQSSLPDSPDLLGILAEYLHQNGRDKEANKAFEWALALESRDPAIFHRFGIRQPIEPPPLMSAGLAR